MHAKKSCTLILVGVAQGTRVDIMMRPVILSYTGCLIGRASAASTAIVRYSKARFVIDVWYLQSYTLFTQLEARASILLKLIYRPCRLLIVTRLVNEADIVNKTRPLFTLSLEMTRLVNRPGFLLVPGVNSDIYGIYC